MKKQKSGASGKIRQSGYLSRRIVVNGKVTHQSNYFVLSEDVLSWFAKKNDTRSIDNICLPCQINLLTDYQKDNAFEVIPLELSENNRFIENRDDGVTLVARNNKDYTEWTSILEGISKRIMEVYIYGDTLADEAHDQFLDQSSEYNQIQQIMQSQLRGMLDSNQFRLNPVKSLWRQPLSIRGLTSEDEDLEYKLDEVVRIGRTPNNEPLFPSTSMSVHNQCNIVAVGQETSYGQHELQFYKLNITQTEAAPAQDPYIPPAASLTGLSAAVTGVGGGYDHTRDGSTAIRGFDAGPEVVEDHDLSNVDGLKIGGNIVDIDWREGICLVATNDGKVLMYKTDIEGVDKSNGKNNINNNDDDDEYGSSKRRNAEKNNGMNVKVLNRDRAIVFNHSNQESYKKPVVPAPGSWMNSKRINSCKISRMANPDCFICVENEWFHLWELRATNRPAFSQQASTSPIFAVEWNPHHSQQFMVAGVSKNLKLIDMRKLSKNPSESVPWRIKDAHSGLIRDIAWNPMVDYWVATCSDDACVKIWDTRYHDAPVRILESHTNGVNTVKWSNSHCELLISGSVDRTLKMWNLRISPHYMLYSNVFSSSVIGCGFSNYSKPLQFYGLSTQGEVRSIELMSGFVKDFVPHRFSNDDVEAQNVELLIYTRDMEQAHHILPSLAKNYYDSQEYSKSQDLLNLVSSVGFNSTLNSKHPFEDMLQKVSSFFHPRCVINTHASRYDVDFCEVMKLRMFVRKVLERKEAKKIMIMKDKIFQHLLMGYSKDSKRFDKHKVIQQAASSVHNAVHPNNRSNRILINSDHFSFNHRMLLQIVDLLKTYDYVEALRWGRTILENYYFLRRLKVKFVSDNQHGQNSTQNTPLGDDLGQHVSFAPGHVKSQSTASGAEVTVSAATEGIHDYFERLAMKLIYPTIYHFTNDPGLTSVGSDVGAGSMTGGQNSAVASAVVSRHGTFHNGAQALNSLEIGGKIGSATISATSSYGDIIDGGFESDGGPVVAAHGNGMHSHHDNGMYPPRADENILRRVESIIKRDFSDFAFVIDQISLLIQLNAELKHGNEPQKIVDIMEQKLSPNRGGVGANSNASLAAGSVGNESESKRNDGYDSGSEAIGRTTSTLRDKLKTPRTKKEGKDGKNKDQKDKDTNGVDGLSLSGMSLTLTGKEENIYNNVSNPVISTTAYRLYFNALLALNMCDKFFIEATKLYNKIKSYEFGYVIYMIMIRHGIPQLSRYLDNRLNKNINDRRHIFHNPLFNDKDRALDNDSGYLEQLYNNCNGIVTMVRIHENCLYLPKELNETIGSYLGLFKNQCHSLYNELLNDNHSKNAMERKNRAKQYGQLLNDQIVKLQTGKSNREYTFREDIKAIINMMTTLGVLDKEKKGQ